MKKGDRVKVISVHASTMPNLYMHPTDLTGLIGQVGTIEVAYTDGTYGIEFDEYDAWLTRKYTGILFTEDRLELTDDLPKAIESTELPSEAAAE